MTNSAVPRQLGEPAKFILHPTDFTQQSDYALAHALRVAVNHQATLCLLHVGNHESEDWDAFPSIREVLHRWGIIAGHAPRSAVTDLGIGIEKVIYSGPNVVEAIEAYCRRHPIDLVVLGTAGRHGVAAWLKPSTAEKIAESVSQHSIPTLFVPADCRGCVKIDSGEVSLDHVLVPVDRTPDSSLAVERGLRAIWMHGGEQADLTLLHVGSKSTFPHVHLPDGPWKVHRVVRPGNPAAEILATVDACHANLIVMVTEGTQGLLDILRGTTTEQVLRQAPCPVLAVPA